QNVVILAETHVYFGSSIDIHIESVQAGDVIRIKGSDGIYNATSGTDAIIIGDDLILEASEESIGTALQPIYTDLFAESILTATAGEDIYIVEKAGNINVGTIYSESGGVYLTAETGSIVDGLNHDFENIAANLLVLIAENGEIGE